MTTYRYVHKFTRTCFKLLYLWKVSFNRLPHATFSQLKILKFSYELPKFDSFLEINGKNLEELYIWGMGHNDNSLNLAIAEYCPNLKTLFTTFTNNHSETLKVILNSCIYLESIRVWCG